MLKSAADISLALCCVARGVTGQCLAFIIVTKVKLMKMLFKVQKCIYVSNSQRNVSKTILFSSLMTSKEFNDYNNVGHAKSLVNKLSDLGHNRTYL